MTAAGWQRRQAADKQSNEKREASPAEVGAMLRARARAHADR